MPQKILLQGELLLSLYYRKIL